MSPDVKSYVHSVKYVCNDHYPNSVLLRLLDRSVDLILCVTEGVSGSQGRCEAGLLLWQTVQPHTSHVGTASPGPRGQVATPISENLLQPSPPHLARVGSVLDFGSTVVLWVLVEP